MYLNLIQVAESFGVSESVVQGWIRDEGLPHTPDRARLLFDREQVAAWAASRGLAAHAGFLAPEASAAASWSMETLLRRGGIWRDVASTAVPDVFRRIVMGLPEVNDSVRQWLAERLVAPGGVAYAPVGGGVALPHPSMRVTLGRNSGVMAILLLRDGLRLNEPVPDSLPVSRLVFFIAPSPRAHLDLLGRLSRLLTRGPLREVLARAVDDDEIYRAVAAADRSSSQSGPRKAGG